MQETSTGWRDPILTHFTPDVARVARLTVVGDADDLLSEQGILDNLRERGFEVIPFEDPVAFRHAYEAGYRDRWDRGEAVSIVVVLHSTATPIDALPYDLLEAARRSSRLLQFSVPNVFPRLDPRVVQGLDREMWDALYRAHKDADPGMLGENQTKDFVLRWVFRIVPDLVTSAADLLKFLLQRHYTAVRVPETIDDRLVDLLERSGRFPGWPLRAIVPDRAAFLAFLQERWPIFIRQRIQAGGRPDGTAEPTAAYGLKFTGPTVLPLDHPDVRVYLDNLFVEGLLQPTDAVPRSSVTESWMIIGVKGDPEQDAMTRFTALTELIEKNLPGEAAHHSEWLKAAGRFGEWVALRWSLPQEAQGQTAERADALHACVEELFQAWLPAHFGSLPNLGHVPMPTMVHHVPKHIAYRSRPSAPGQPAGRLALLLMDGLAMDQWGILRSTLADVDVQLEEAATFAWVPTLTSVSRQAVFSGQMPALFAPSLWTTAKEEQHWKRFWENSGTPAPWVRYMCQKDREDDASLVGRVRDVVADPNCRVLGLVVGVVDQMMHGATMGTRGLHHQVADWADQGTFRTLVTVLVGGGFDVYMTADHGNVEARGMGRPNVGSIANQKGERAYAFGHEGLREQVHAAFPETIVWPAPGLPPDCHVLLAAGRSCFTTKGAMAVSHGGIALEEVVVPFVRITRAT